MWWVAPESMTMSRSVESVRRTSCVIAVWARKVDGVVMVAAAMFADKENSDGVCSVGLLDLRFGG
jgi:hypothetical protein